MFKKIKNIHFVGIGGIGMSGIAEVLQNLGYEVSGSDLQLTEVTDHLQSLGAKIYKDHTANNVRNADLVVYSSAVKMDNPEIVAALERKIPVIRRAEMLGELMRVKYGIAISGTHGKTTTTSMAGLILTEGGLDPTLIIGGKVRSLRTNAQLGKSEYLVAEADEFDRSFLQLTPSIAVITNIEADHLDTYKNLTEIKDAFVEFGNRVPFFGCTIVCLDDTGVQDILPRLKKTVRTYGMTPQADFCARDLKFQENKSWFEVFQSDTRLGAVQLQVPGHHNVQNALAAITLGTELGISFEKIKGGLEKFNGVHRRFEIKAEINGMTVIDDYAHHPTEIEATLSGVKQGYGRRIVVVFQPHLYSRTRDFCQDFGRSFFHADVLIITDIYPSRETPLPGITGEIIALAAKSVGHKNVNYVPDKTQVPDFLMKIKRSGDMIFTMGAGDIWKQGEIFIQKLKTE